MEEIRLLERDRVTVGKVTGHYFLVWIKMKDQILENRQLGLLQEQEQLVAGMERKCNIVEFG